jgi:hypothetical protein
MRILLRVSPALSAFDPKDEEGCRPPTPAQKIFSRASACAGGSGASPSAQRREVAFDVPTATLLRADEVIEKRFASNLSWVIRDLARSRSAFQVRVRRKADLISMP